MSNNIFLIGLMGSGKTTVGRKLANLLGFQFIDIDQELIHRTGVSIAHIFEVEGEQGFRERESRLLTEISQGENAVVSTGGGVVNVLGNHQIMRSAGKVIHIEVPIHIIWKRLKDCQHRPLLQVEDPRTRLEQLKIERDPLYIAAAHHTINVATDSAAKTARRIQQIILQNQ